MGENRKKKLDGQEKKGIPIKAPNHTHTHTQWRTPKAKRRRRSPRKGTNKREFAFCVNSFAAD